VVSVDHATDDTLERYAMRPPPAPEVESLEEHLTVSLCVPGSTRIDGTLRGGDAFGGGENQAGRKRRIGAAGRGPVPGRVLWVNGLAAKKLRGAASLLRVILKSVAVSLGDLWHDRPSHMPWKCPATGSRDIELGRFKAHVLTAESREMESQQQAGIRHPFLQAYRR